MQKTYVVKNTAGTLNFVLKPGALNGPGGATRTSDVKFHGSGSYEWGEGVNVNFYHLVENFACPQKVTGDNLPAYLGGSAPFPNTDYDSSTHPVAPKDEYDLGQLGLGITYPMPGQSWYNTDTNLLNNWNSVLGEWNVSGGIKTLPTSDQPASPNEGELWYDSDIEQLMIYEGSWESVAKRYLLLDGTSAMTGVLNMNSQLIQNVADPVNNQDATTKVYVDTAITAITSGGALDSIYVNATGDTMTGTLYVQNSLGVQITNSTAPHLYISSTSTGTTPGGIVMYNADNDPGAGGGSGTYGWTKLTQRDGHIFTIEQDTSYSGMVDSSIVAKIDQVGIFTFYGDGTGTGGDISLPNASISQNDHVATKQYVDSVVSGAGSSIVWTSLSSSAAQGDIAITGGKIYINLAAGANWKQVWPAQYS